MSDFAEDTNVPTNDCISRKAVIDALDVLCQEHRYKIPGKIETYSQYNEAWQDALDRAEGAIFNLPSAQQWIPVTERLPELKERVLVYAEDDKSWYIAISQVISPPSPKVYFLGFNGTQKIKAWMPLPTPWKGEENDK